MNKKIYFIVGMSAVLLAGAGCTNTKVAETPAQRSTQPVKEQLSGRFAFLKQIYEVGEPIEGQLVIENNGPDFIATTLYSVIKGGLTITTQDGKTDFTISNQTVVDIETVASSVGEITFVYTITPKGVTLPIKVFRYTVTVKDERGVTGQQYPLLCGHGIVTDADLACINHHIKECIQGSSWNAGIPNIIEKFTLKSKTSAGCIVQREYSQHPIAQFIGPIMECTVPLAVQNSNEFISFLNRNLSKSCNGPLQELILKPPKDILDSIK